MYMFILCDLLFYFEFDLSKFTLNYRSVLCVHSVCELNPLVCLCTGSEVNQGQGQI